MSLISTGSGQHRQRGLSAHALILGLAALALLVALTAGVMGTLFGVSAGDSAREARRVAGERLFERLGCGNCHGEQAGARGPALTGLLDSQVTLQSGETVRADKSYVRESILNPGAKVLAGYDLIMPVYQGQIGEEALSQLVTYIGSLRAAAAVEVTPEAGENER